MGLTGVPGNGSKKILVPWEFVGPGNGTKKILVPWELPRSTPTFLLFIL
jgi:hypothetical protein